LVLAAISRADRENRDGLISDEIHAYIISEADWAAEKLIDSTVAALSKSVSETGKTVTDKDDHFVSDGEVDSASVERFRVATIDFDVPRAAIATRILMANHDRLEVTRIVDCNATTLRRWGAEAPDAIFVSITSADKRDEAIALARMLRKRGFDGWIVLGWWRTKSPRQSTRRHLKDAGYDYVTHRLKAMDRMLRYAAESTAITSPEPSAPAQGFAPPAGS
jgi:hypothetical protein